MADFAHRHIRETSGHESVPKAHNVLAPEVGRTTLVNELDLPSTESSAPANRGPYRSLFAGGLPWQQPTVAGTHAIEPGSTGSGTEQRRDPDDAARATAIIAGFHAARRELERLPPQQESAVRHLEQALDAALDYDRLAKADAVADAADGFDRLLARIGTGSARLGELNTVLRRRLKLTLNAGAETKRGTNSGDADAKTVFASVSSVLEVRARQCLDYLENEGDSSEFRTVIVTRFSADIERTGEYLVWLLERVPEVNRAELQPATAGAALAVGRILRWVRSRTGHKEMEAALLRGLRAFDLALRKVGAVPLELRDAMPLSERSQHSSDRERLAMTQEIATLKTTLDKMEKRQTEAINTFESIAILDDEQQFDFKLELLKALISTTVGFYVSSLQKILAGGNPAASKAPGVSAADGLSTVAVGTLNATFAGALAGAATVNPKRRALAFFASSMRIASSDRLFAIATNIDMKVRRSEITPDEVQFLRRVLEANKDSVFERHYQRTTTAWASYLAQSRLGTQFLGHQRVSKMNDYFGKEGLGGRQFGTSRSGGDGVLALHMNVEVPGTRPKIDHSLTRIVGLNSDLKQTVLQTASYQLDRVMLPKEVNVYARFGRATIALDEANHIRDVVNWNEVERFVGLPPVAFWRSWGHDITLR